jgi:uncharacterized membrane protein
MTTHALPFKPFKSLLLIALFVLGVWFLSRELVDAATRDRSGESALRNVALIVHLTFATPLLLLPIVQFSRRVRMRWPAWHRRAGWLYLVSAIIAASVAIYLGLTFDSLGRRTPTTIFAALWLFFSVAALISARRRAIAVHERFIIRSYAMALAFVFVRVMGQAEDTLFAFLPTAELRGVTREWLCFVLPLLAVEMWHTWLPAVRSATPRR